MISLSNPTNTAGQDNGQESWNAASRPTVWVDTAYLNTLLIGNGQQVLPYLTALLNKQPAGLVTLIATELTAEIQDLQRLFPNLTVINRPVTASDLDGKQLIIDTSSDSNVDPQPIFHESASRFDLYFPKSLASEHQLQSQNIVERLSLPLAAGEEAILATFPHQNLDRIRDYKWRRIATLAMTAFGLLLIFNVLSFYVPVQTWPKHIGSIDHQFWLFLGVGFLAQLADGLLGMGYGVVTQIFLLNAGVPLAAVSSSIHTAEVFTAGASGYSHYRFGNVNRRLFRVLVLPGVLGAIAGALLLSWLGEENAGWVKPLLAAYTLLLGIRILSRAFVKKKTKRKARRLGWLAGAGGFLDSFGGGGWGPLVTSTLLAKGKTPQYVIGTVSLTEFFVTFASAITFFTFIGMSHWLVIAGLLIGGVTAAPFSARLAGKLPVRWMFMLVGVMVVFWSLRVLWKYI